MYRNNITQNFIIISPNWKQNRNLFINLYLPIFIQPPKSTRYVILYNFPKVLNKASTSYINITLIIYNHTTPIDVAYHMENILYFLLQIILIDLNI